jgi:hypothetical protein
VLQQREQDSRGHRVQLHNRVGHERLRHLLEPYST